MKSMTAYAQASFSIGYKRYRLEIQSLNKKGLEIQTDLPSSLSTLAIPIRLWLATKLERGSLIVRLKEEGGDRQLLSLDDLKSVKSQLEGIASDLGYSKDVVSFGMLLERSMNYQAQELQLSDIEKALEQATLSLIRMREVEGERLKADLKERLKFIYDSIIEIENQQKEVPLKIKDNLIQRIEALKIQNLEEERISKEVIFYVEKQDVSEEITRLKSHLHQMNTLCDSHEPIGRRLEFLTQECFRELNTLCAKTSELLSINLTLVLKAELEKIKEQIMNIE